MANTYKVIDDKTWERTMHCMIFRNSVEPAFCVTFDADITNFFNLCGRNRIKLSHGEQTFLITPYFFVIL